MGGHEPPPIAFGRNKIAPLPSGRAAFATSASCRTGARRAVVFCRVGRHPLAHPRVAVAAGTLRDGVVPNPRGTPIERILPSESPESIRSGLRAPGWSLEVLRAPR